MAAPKKTPAKPREKSPKPKTPKSSASKSSSSSKSPSRASKVSKFTHRDVYFFVPNLTGYLRVILTALGIYLLVQADRHKTKVWQTGLAAYAMSFVLDFFDGYFARLFKQSSDYGAVLDMVTDRVSTMLLLVVLTTFYPAHFEIYAFLAALDYSSHWVQMYAAKGHHKTANQDKNIIVRTFYGVYPFFGFCCVGTEFFYIVSAALHFDQNNEILAFFRPILQFACICKNIVNLAQLCSGFEAIAKRDVANQK